MKKFVVALSAFVVLAVVSGLLLRGQPGRESGPVNILLVSVDTLRADRLGSYEYTPGRTPAIDAVAARGVRFADASTVAPLTLPAHASLVTGTFPAYHGVRDNGGFYLDVDDLTLAEILQGVGYRTGAFVGAFVLDSRWGLDQGFDRYFDDFDLSTTSDGAMDAVQHRADVVVDRALEWLDREPEKPFFAWVHLYDPHTPYEAPAEFASRFPATVHGAYDAEIAWTDAQIGRLLTRLSSDGRLDQTLVVIVGDHGESLGEHREQQHGFFVYEATLRIPMIFAGPGVPTGVVPEPVRIVDVVPTVLDLVGVPISPVVQGRSLRPGMRGERLDIVAFAETWYPRHRYGWSELMAIRDGRYKFILGPRRELYDVVKDPGETHDLSVSDARTADAAERALRSMLADMTSRKAARGRQPIDPDAEARLRALGYIGGAGARSDSDPSGPRSDPKDKIDLYNLLKAAGQDVLDKKSEDAIEKLTRVLAQDAEVIEAHVILGNLYTNNGRHPEAAQAYRRALALNPENEGAAYSLALAYRKMGRFEEARVGFERARALDPRRGRAQFQLADLAMQQGDFERAIATLTDALRLDADRPTFLVKLAECHIELKQYARAEPLLREALARDSTIAQAHYDLGLIHDARGETQQAMAEYKAYEATIGDKPRTYAAAFNLGKLLMRSGRPFEAAARFRDAVAANPEFAEGYLYLAKALLDAGDLRGAEHAARTGLKARPRPTLEPLGHYVLADVYNRLGRSGDADRELAAARALERD
jgi:arylsulfatase A-like enzyme/Tfp pilus assembly protein PilF